MAPLSIRGIARYFACHPRWVVRAVQLVIFAVSGVLAFILRFDFAIPAQFRPHLLEGFCIFVPAKILAFTFFRLDRGWWRYAAIRDVIRLSAANVIGSVLGYVGLVSLAPGSFPRSVYLLDFLLCFGMTAGI